jgi:hypothetical protein
MWLTQNGKMKRISGVKTFNWGIPAFRSESGFNTCPNAQRCAAGCYARGGAYRFSNVRPAFERRLALARDSTRLVREIVDEIKFRGIERVRVHDSGDFFDARYLDDWIGIARACPSVRFYCYTKMVALFKMKSEQIPPNFVHVFSYGGKQDALIDVESDFHSRVFGSVAELREAGYVDATEDDALAASGEHRRLGLVYHGARRFEDSGFQN